MTLCLSVTLFIPTPFTMVKCRVFILTQLNINQRQRLWALMDTHTRQPLLYPLIYLIDGSPKELTRLATQLTGRLSIHKAEFRTLTHSRQMNNGTTHKRFRSLTAEMVMAFYQIITPGSISKKNPLNPFPAGEIQLRNFLIWALLNKSNFC